MPYEADCILSWMITTLISYVVISIFPLKTVKPPANWKAKEKELIDGMEKKFRQDFLNNLRVRQRI